ncbi:hypothetical protein DQW77_13220 [Roseovarius sp. TE539]|uniref:DUF6880 family protein n=1 Tax=Roseovarius sp. TE539 TaxID=2249812 RepID=UPI000DE0BB2E|nr:DUF6880 family protein [Roseovarius sp. TE539]RBI70908.1 hypothetical protein DQW77_13220 [Roseovarius sp. TE539]
MSRKTLNKTNLERLGAAALADLVLDLVAGNAALQRQARMALSAAQGPKDIAADIRKRFAALRRASGFLDWRKQRALVKELDGLLDMIESRIAPEEADTTFELLWSFLQLAPSIHERTDDSNGAVGDVMGRAVELIGAVAPRITAEPRALAERVLEAVAEADFGEFDGIIPATAEALGPDGLAHLKQITNQWANTPPAQAELDKWRRFGLSTAPEEIVKRNRESTRSIILSDIADAQGDVDAYMARYTEEQLTYGTIAPGVARRLLDAGRVEEAHGIITRARATENAKGPRMFRHDLDEVYEECLQKLGHHDTLKDHLWDRFRAGLSAPALRRYLSLLPDFEDMEAEEAALDFVEAQAHPVPAVRFLVDWPAPARAARVVLARAAELDGNRFETLTPAAEALDADHPLAATLMRRAMIDDTLRGAKSKRYRHAARHLADCAACDSTIADYGDHPTHESFLATLRENHGRKHGFWSLVDG